jgi:GntR family transcriptional regulator/MocR family aminotransferase
VRAKSLNLFLDGGSTGALYLRVAEALVRVLTTGALPEGQSLPGIRELAEQLGVNKNTVLAALKELEAQGWIQARPRVGFFPAVPLPAAQGGREVPAEREGPAFDIPSRLTVVTDMGGVRLDLTEGEPDGRMVACEPLARALQRGLRLKGVELLRGREPKGVARLRERLAAHLAQARGLPGDPEGILLLRSPAMAVTLAVQALVGPGAGEIAVEDPGSPALWETLRQASAATLHPVAVDGDGARPESVEAILGNRRLNLLILTPQCHHPTGAPLSPDRRARILSLARLFRFPILELDLEHDLVGMPLRPLAAENGAAPVIYVGAVSRLMAPGGCAYLVAAPALADRLARAKRNLDPGGDPVLEWALSEMMLDGEYDRHVRRIRKATQARREMLQDALRHTFPGQMAFEDRGGGALWLEGRGPLSDPDRFTIWVRSCGMKGLKLRPGSAYRLGGEPLAATRLGFSAWTPQELQQAIAQVGR